MKRIYTREEVDKAAASYRETPTQEPMAIIPKSNHKKIEIDLSGPQGNAYHLLGYGRSLAKQLGKTWKPIQTEMMKGDYEHLLEVFTKHFGDYVDLVRDNSTDDDDENYDLYE